MARGFKAFAAVRLTCAVVALVSTSACGATGDDSRSHVPSSPSSGSATAAVSMSPAGNRSICSILQTAEVSDLVGEPVTTVASSSTESVCTYRATVAEPTFDVAIRLEDTFEDLRSIRDTFTDGTDLRVGEAAYWSPSVATLWFSTGQLLYAVQVIGAVQDDRAVAIATALAGELAGRL